MVSVEHKFREYRDQVAQLVQAQAELCNRFIREAEPLLKKARPDDGSNPPKDADQIEYQAGLLLYRVKLGQPRSEALARIFEEPRNQQLVQRVEGLLLATSPRRTCTPRRRSSSSRSRRSRTKRT